MHANAPLTVRGRMMPGERSGSCSPRPPLHRRTDRPLPEATGLSW
jgi:hypothetical protein